MAKAAPGILWAEDDRQDQTLIQAALADVAHAPRVVFVEDGVQLLEAVGRDPPDLVVLDLKMPRMGGLETLRRLRAEPATQKLPVVMFSSGSLPDEIAQCRELGALAFVQKPIAFGAFVAAVHAIVTEAAPGLRSR